MRSWRARGRVQANLLKPLYETFRRTLHAEFKTAAGNFAPLLALGFAAALGGCATQKKTRSRQSSTPAPQIEAIYAHDNNFGASLGGLYDVRDLGQRDRSALPEPRRAETGAQNAADIEPVPAGLQLDHRRG